MIELRIFEESDTNDIIDLVLHCQNDGTRPLVTVDDQPELLSIHKKYFESGGCFWVAKEENELAGSIGLMDYGNGIGLLKKFFVYEKYRGKPHHLGQKLYAQLMEFARLHNFKEIILDTPKNTDRAHIFYEKAGFVKIDQADLPVEYDYPYKDCDFFLLKLS